MVRERFGSRLVHVLVILGVLGLLSVMLAAAVARVWQAVSEGPRPTRDANHNPSAGSRNGPNPVKRTCPVQRADDPGPTT